MGGGLRSTSDITAFSHVVRGPVPNVLCPILKTIVRELRIMNGIVLYIQLHS